MCWVRESFNDEQIRKTSSDQELMTTFSATICGQVNQTKVVSEISEQNTTFITFVIKQK